MRKIKIQFVAIFSILLFSCSDNDETDPVQKFNRNITLKVIGEDSGELKVTYSNPENEFGITPVEIISTLPWNKNLRYKNKVKLTGLAVTGSNGLPNEILQLQIYSNAKIIESEYGISDNDGKLYT